MILEQSIKLRRPIDETLKVKVNGYTFQVGVLQSKIRRKALPPHLGSKNMAGGPARKLGVYASISNNEVSKHLRNYLNFNYLVKPFSKKTDDAVRMLKVFFDICFTENGATKIKRLENLLQAIVRNPFLRGDYGPNSARAILIKGFSRKGIDTGQLFKSITAKVRSRK